MKLTAGGDPTKLATDHTMQLLQEAHDGYTRVTLAIKKIGIQILNQNIGGNAKSLQARSHQILKDLVPSSEKIEEVLFSTPRHRLLDDEVMKIINKSVTPYAAAWQFYCELVAILRSLWWYEYDAVEGHQEAAERIEERWLQSLLSA